MKKIRCSILLVAFIVSGNDSALAQATGAKQAAKKAPAAQSAEQAVEKEVYGKIESVKENLLTLRTRSGTLVQVDVKPAVEAFRSVPLVVGRSVSVKGTADKAGVIHAEILQRAKESAAVWPVDR